jgi:hypothetical protein
MFVFPRTEVDRLLEVLGTKEMEVSVFTKPLAKASASSIA